MVRNPPAGKSLELVVICPSLVMGKLLFKTECSSAYIATGLMTGKIPKAPVVHVPVVDVEDVAKAHVLAVTAPAGERYSLIDDTYKLVDLGQAFAAEFKQYGYKCTEKELSYCLAKILSCCVSDVRTFVKIWDRRRHINNEKSIKKLGLTKYKPMKDSVKEMGWSLIELGMVPDKTKGKK